MGNNIYTKYNTKGDIDIILSLNKVCYYPGENIKGKIKLIPKIVLYQEWKKNELIIKITQYGQYTYSEEEGKSKMSDEVNLVNNIFKFNDLNEKDNEIEINFILPKYTPPSIYIDKDNYVKNFITIEYPYFHVKRTWVFIVKNHFKYHFTKINFESPFIYQSIYNKKRFNKNKGSCQLKLNLQRNFFLYDERI